MLLRASGSAPSALPYWERGLLPLTLAALWTFHSVAPQSQGPRIWPQPLSSPPIPGPSWLLNPQHDLLTLVNLQNLSLWAPSPPHSDTRPSLRHWVQTAHPPVTQMHQLPPSHAHADLPALLSSQTDLHSSNNDQSQHGQPDCIFGTIGQSMAFPNGYLLVYSTNPDPCS